MHPDYVCNNNCRFCITGDLKTRKYLSTSEIMDRLDNLDIDENSYITLIGGEATIRPDIIKLMSYISKKGGKPCLLSNGRRFAQYDFASEILKAGLREVRISIYGHNAKLHDWLTRVPGSFDQTLQGVKNLVNLKEKYNLPLHIELKTLVCKPTASHLSKIINLFCKKISSPDVGIGIYGMALRGNALKNINDVGIRLSEAKEYIKEALDLAISFKQNIRLTDIPLCILGDLKYLPCCPRASFSELQITEHKKRLQLEPNHERVKGLSCKYCKINNVCPGIWIYYAKIYGTEELVPFR